LAIDYEGIAALQSYENRSLGIRETLMRPMINRAHTVAVLSTPLHTTPEAGWVICHSFAMEHIFLQPLQASLARRLAGAGFAVLRFDAHGYGDSELGFESMTLSSQVADSCGAAAVLAEVADVRAIGFFGCRLGGTVAALAADGEDAGLVAVNPVVRGEPYIQSQLRYALWAQPPGAKATLEVTPLDELRSKGVIDMGEFPLTRELFEEISRLDLAEELQGFRGKALVLNVSTSASLDPDLERLGARLAELGGQVDTETVVDSAAHRLGLYRWRSITRSHKIDTQQALSEGIIEKAVAWCLADQRTPEMRP
jgi:pimeloyl-ACP methyl ester carboxylesterase